MLVDSETLASHHRRCDELFVLAREASHSARWSELRSSLQRLREALLSHFSFEESHIFPLYEQASGIEGGTEWLCAQHDDMRGMLWLLGTISLEAERDCYQSELAALQAAFDAHAADEEKRMYPVFERLLRK
jgi:hemerythrin superfamily protein